MIYISYTKYKQISAVWGPQGCADLGSPGIRRRDFDPRPNIRETYETSSANTSGTYILTGL